MLKIDKMTQEYATEMGLQTVEDEVASDNTHIYPFDCPPLDVPHGGGILSGRIYEYIGEESHGKTTFALEITKAFSNYMVKHKITNWNIVWIESEATLDRARAKFMGCPVEKFLTYDSDVFEDCRDKILALLNRAKQKGTIFMFVWDTIAAAATKNEKMSEPEEEVEEDDDDDDTGPTDSVKAARKAKHKPKKKQQNAGGLVEKPRLIRQMLRDITVPLGETNSTFIVLNQMTTQIGKFLAPLDSSGGKGLRHHASVRGRLSREDEKERKMPSGQTKVYAIKSILEFKKNKITGLKMKTAIILNNETGLDKLETRLIYMKDNKLVPPVKNGWTEMKIPAGYADKTKLVDGKPLVPGMIDVKFQVLRQLEELCKTYPHLLDWLDYIMYTSYTVDSALMKAKNIHKLWEYEEKFFGVRKTQLTEQESEVSKMLFDNLVKEQDIELAKEDEEKKVVIPKKENKFAPKNKAAKPAVTKEA